MVARPPTAGRPRSPGPANYYLKLWTKQRSALAVRNPYWNRNKEPWKSLRRPANVDAIEWTFGNSLDATKLRMDKNEADLGNIPPAAVAQLTQPVYTTVNLVATCKK